MPPVSPTAQSRRRYLTVLAVLLLLFCLRVLGQALVAFFHVSFLPPMEAWFSGVLPYPWLLSSQILIIVLYGKVCWDFVRGYGYFITPRPSLGAGLVKWGGIYFVAMIVRYALRMALYPQERWVGGCIPIFFHWVLATFLIVLGTYHLSAAKRLKPSIDLLNPEA